LTQRLFAHCSGVDKSIFPMIEINDVTLNVIISPHAQVSNECVEKEEVSPHAQNEVKKKEKQTQLRNLVDARTRL
jgi:hypothetical protein